MSTVVLPGSFDPFTLGHLDLTRRAAALGHQVIIAVSHNPSKKGILGLEARTGSITRTLAQEDLSGTVEVRTLPKGLLVDFCGDIDTVFLLTDSAWSHISSSLVREVHALGGDVSDMLPGPSLDALRAAAAAS